MQLVLMQFGHLKKLRLVLECRQANLHLVTNKISYMYLNQLTPQQAVPSLRIGEVSRSSALEWFEKPTVSQTLP